MIDLLPDHNPEHECVCHGGKQDRVRDGEGQEELQQYWRGVSQTSSGKIE